MISGFWSKLNKPIMALAPMADVTDAAFRRIIARYGKPDVMFTEFVSADGLCHTEGRKKLLHNLSYTEAERPIVAQLFSGRPEKMFEAAKLVAELGFDGLDINMGCPDRSIEKSGAGAALMKNPVLARAIIRAAKEGVASYSPFPKGRGPLAVRDLIRQLADSGLPACANASAGREDSATSPPANRRADFMKGGIKTNVPIPVSIKTRLGYNKDELDTWLTELLAEKPAAVTVHARTRKEMSNVPARWERVKRAVEIRDGLKSETLILGNGDVMNIAEANERAKETGADGVMLGRAIFGNPFLFSDGGKRSDLSPDSRTVLEEPSVRERLRVMLEHTKLFEELFKDVKNFAVMKKHYKAYVQGFDGSKELRVKLMETESAVEVENIVKKFLK